MKFSLRGRREKRQSGHDLRRKRGKRRGPERVHGTASTSNIPKSEPV